MCDIGVMGYGPAEFYSKFGLKAEKMSQMFRAGLAFDPDGMHHGILKCSETGMCDEAFRSRCIHLANLWDEGGYDNPMVELVYVLDYATPYEVRRQYKRGDVVVLETPEELGFTLPSTHTFKSWTHLGQDITEVTVIDNMVIEGRVEQAPRANLIRGSRFINPYDDRATAPPPQPIDIQLYAVRSGRWADISTGSDYNSIRLLNTGTTYSIRFFPSDRGSSPGRSTIVLSFMARTSAVNGSTSMLQVNGSNYLTAFIDGVSNEFNPSGRKDLIIPNDARSHIIEVVFSASGAESQDFSVTSFGSSAGPSVQNPMFVWLPKLEDVTGLPEEEQRATAWVPHVDDVN